MVVSREEVLDRPASSIEIPSTSAASASPHQPAPASSLPTSPLASPPPHHPTDPALAPSPCRRRRSRGDAPPALVEEQGEEEDEDPSAKIPKARDAARAETLMPDALTCPVCYIRHVGAWMFVNQAGIPSDMGMMRLLTFAYYAQATKRPITRGSLLGWQPEA